MPHASFHTPEQKQKLLETIAQLLRDFEDVPGFGCSNDTMAEIWLDDGNERYLWNGGTFDMIPRGD
jgi:hypothetical protein